MVASWERHLTHRSSGRPRWARPPLSSRSVRQQMKSRWWYLLLVLVAACERNELRRHEVLIETSAAAPVVEGSWYSSDGREELVIGKDGPRLRATVFWPDDFQHRLVRAAFLKDGVHFWIEGRGATRESSLRWLENDSWRVEAVDPWYPPGHGYYMTKDPSAAWVWARRTERLIDQGQERAERFVDWLVRTL